MATAERARDAHDLGGQYEKLLATVGKLQTDLQRTVGVCQVRSVGVQVGLFEVGRNLKSGSKSIPHDLVWAELPLGQRS